MGRLDRIYARLPVWAQHGAVSAFGLYWRRLRFGPGYEKYAKGFAEREHFTREQWQAWQQERLKKILRIAATEVPYYQRTWSAGMKADALKGKLEALPLLDKDPIRANPKDFDRGENPPLVFHTSGSTGTPIASHWTVQELRASMAIREVRSARWAGVSFRLPRATFSGRLAEPDPASKGPFYRFNVFEHQVYFSPFHLRPDTAWLYLKALRDHRVQWLTGYAVSYYLLARYILEQRLQVPPLKAIITTSEKVTPEMRQVMQAAFRCRVFEEYSTVENALFASECEYGRLHISPDWGIVEILGKDGTPCPPNQDGEVVATCLMREFQPFVRFRLGDLAAWDSEPCLCQRQMPILKGVAGRIEDVVVGPDGRQMVRFHGIFVDQPHIREGQIIQESLAQIRVKVVPTGEYGPADAQDVIRRVKQRLGDNVQVFVEPVPSILRTKAGKFQAVISHVLRPEATPDGQE